MHIIVHVFLPDSFGILLNKVCFGESKQNVETMSSCEEIFLF